MQLKDEMEVLVSKNREGLEKLAEEEAAERYRSTSSIVLKLKRLYRRHLASPETVEVSRSA